MKTDIILAGVGGQGILTIATIIGYAAIKADLNLKQAEVHGMSQRGGDVQSHLRISDREIFSDLIPYNQADMILSVEPMESLRYIPYLSEKGWLITNDKPVLNIPNYPDLEKVFSEIGLIENSLLINADDLAKQIDAPRSMNIIMLGAASNHIDIPYEYFCEGIKTIFSRKGENIIEQNLRALETGKNFK